MSHYRNPDELLPPVTRDFILEKPLPNSSDAERAILGAIVLDNALIWVAIQRGITPELFYVPSNKWVFQAMLGLAEKGSEINPILIAEELKLQEYEVSAVGGIPAISNLTYGLPHFASIENYAKIILDKHWKRVLIKLCNVVTSQALEDDDTAQMVIEGAEALILGVASQALRGSARGRSIDFVHIKDDQHTFTETLESRSKGIADAIPTGLKPIDDKLEGGGVNPQGLYYVASQPKTGKTSLVLGIAKRAAQLFADHYAKTGERQSVAIASLEMRRQALQMRMFSAHTGIPFDTLSRPGKLRGVEKDLAFGSIEHFFSYPLYINDAVFTLPEFARACERVVNGEMQARLIIADYVQLFSLAKGKIADPDSLTGQVTVISRELKHLAQELNVPIIGISSVNDLGQLRQSRTLEYDLEALIRLENPEFKPNMTPDERAKLDAKPVWDINARLAYQRNGPTGDIMLKFLKRYMQFVTVEEYESLTNGNGSSGNHEETLSDLWNQIGSEDDPFTLKR